MTAPAELSILVVDNDLQGRGRGVMFCAAGGITPADVNMMATHARGVVGVALSEGRAFALDLAPMTTAARRPGCPCYLASIEAYACSETGISAHERATTIAALGAWSARPADFHSPGHVMPAVVNPEAASGHPIDIAHAWCMHVQGALATAWCDILDARGEVASSNDCRSLATALHLPLISYEDAVTAVAQYRRWRQAA